MPSGQTLATASEEVSGSENLISMIDPLASKTRRVVLSQEQLESEQDRPFGDVTSNSAEAVMLFYQAQEFADQAAVVKAVELYDKALELDPDFFLAKQYRAIQLMGNYAFLEGVDVEKLSNYEKLFHRSQQAWAEDDFTRIAAIADQMLALRPGCWIGLNNKYCAQYFIGQYEDAIQTCETAIRNGYRGYYEHLILNSSYVMSGLSNSEIIRRYLMLLEEDPSDAMMRFWLAITHLISNNNAEAQKHLNAVLEVYPENDTLMKVAADTYTWRESPDKAVDYETALSYLHNIRELYVARLGEEDATMQDPDNFDWLLRGVPFSFRLGEIHFLRGDMESAIEDYERGLEIAPEHYNSFYRLGLAYESLGETDRAIENFRKYIDVSELNSYDATAIGREETCAAIPACHSISRPVAVKEAMQRIDR
jgi:tetratricopeptide (TPR) repeat protein